MLSINELSVSYDSQILNGISLDVRPGELVCLIGKSGSGKTSLLNKICEGDAKIKRSSSMALITQESLLLDWRTALENVLLPPELNGKVTAGVISKAKELLLALGLENSFNKLPRELSGGMKQRVSLARGLLQDAELYLFDEPLSAIDFDLRIQLGKLIRNFIVSAKKGALFVTHNIEEAISLGDRVIVLGGNPGKITHEEVVSFKETERDPISVRAAPEFSRLFANLWAALGI